MFVPIIVLMVLAVGLNALIGRFERIVAPWQEEIAGTRLGLRNQAHSALLASRAPSTRLSNLAQTISSSISGGLLV